MTLFRMCLLAKLLDQRATSKELVGKLLARRHPGYVGDEGGAALDARGAT